MRGRSIPVSIPRRIVTDYMRLSATIPSIPIERTMDLGAVAAARDACSPRPPWVALFGNAFALTAQEFPELRRIFLKWPWPHLYEYPASVAMFAIDRVYRGEPCVLPCMIKEPAVCRIRDLARIIRHAKEAPLDEIKAFRRVLGMAKLPGPVRRLLWWLGFSIGHQRGNYFGTFVVSTVSAFGAELIHPIAVTPIFLTYGIIGADHRCPVRLMFDHRVVDGVPVARALVRLEAILNTTILEELRTARAAAAPSPAAGVEPAAYPAKLPAKENSPP